MTPYGNRLDALIVSMSKGRRKEEEEKNTDKWVPSVILSGIGLGAQIWVATVGVEVKKVEH